MSQEKTFEEYLRDNNGFDIWYVDNNGDNEGSVPPGKETMLTSMLVTRMMMTIVAHGGLVNSFDLTLTNFCNPTKQDAVCIIVLMSGEWICSSDNPNDPVRHDRREKKRERERRTE